MLIFWPCASTFARLMDEDVNDIVEEIRAHILDKTWGEAPEDTVASTLAALGTPEELASRYRTDEFVEARANYPLPAGEPAQSLPLGHS